MSRHRKSSIASFLGIYFGVALAVAVAFFLLWKQNEARKAERQVRIEEARAAALAEEEAAKAAADAEAERRREVAAKVAAARAAEAKAKERAAEAEEARLKREAEERRKAALAKDPKPGPTEEEKELARLEAEIAALYPMPAIRPLEEIVGNWKEVPPNAFPKMVTINRTIEFEVERDGAVMARGEIPAGSSVVPLELNGDQLTVSTSRTMSFHSLIHIDETDFKDRIRNRYELFVGTREETALAHRQAEMDRRLAAIEKEEQLAGFNDGSDARFDPMKASLRRGEAGIFELEDASEWRWIGTEDVDGVTYDVGLAAFETESAFGVTRTEIKALIADGKVVKWLDTTTGETL